MPIARIGMPSRGRAWESGRLSAVRVYLGSDHAGFELKAAIVTWLGEAGHEAVDCGPARSEERRVGKEC